MSASRYMSQSCSSCRAKKRKCDKRLPVCSRCQQNDQQCLYGNRAHNLYGLVVPITDEHIPNIQHGLLCDTKPAELAPLKPMKACHSCRHAKKSCDKAESSCARCKRLGRICIYDQSNELEMLRTQHFFARPSPSVHLNYKPDYPTEYRNYFPKLIRFFQDKMGLSPFDVEDHTLAYYLRSSWVRNALTDPCLFHATMFSASVQLNALTRNEGLNYVTLYHQSNTARLLRTRLISPDYLSDATVASVLLLAIHGSIQFDAESTEAHRQGLIRIVATRGGLNKLGFNGFLAHIIQTENSSLAFLAILYDQPDPFPIPEWKASLFPIKLINMVLDGIRQSPNEILRNNLLGLFHDMQHLVDQASMDGDMLTGTVKCKTRLRYFLDRMWSKVDPAYSKVTCALSTKELALLRACFISGRILAYLIDDRVPWLDQQLDQFVKELEKAIDKTDRSTWLKHGPEANMWIAVMGSAMAENINGRRLFILKERCVASSIRGNEPSLHVEAWFCYRWLKNMRLAQRENRQSFRNDR